MALINCPDCGHKISDKAEKCINCGRVMIGQEEIKCNECGGILSGSEAICPHCGFVLQPKEESAEQKEVVKVKNNKKMPLIIGVALIVILGLILAIGGGNGTSAKLNSQGYFEEFIWGMGYDQVEDLASSYGDIRYNEGNPMCLIEDYKEINGLDATIMFTFENKGLDQIIVLFSTNADCQYSLKELESEFINTMNKDYGEGTEHSGFQYWIAEKSTIATAGIDDGFLGIIYDSDTKLFD